MRIGIFALLFSCLVLTQIQSSFAQSADQPKPISSLWDQRIKGNDWSTLLGEKHDGISTEKGIITDWSNGKLKPVWKIEVGEGYSLGSVAKGRYFHFDFSKGKARLRCFNAETGKPLWKFEYDSVYKDSYGFDRGPRSNPIFDDDRIYIVGVEGMIHCLNAVDGTEVWKLDSVKKFGLFQNFFGVGGTPAIYKDLLIAIVGGSTEASRKITPPTQVDRLKSNGTAVVAFDKMTGKVKYKFGDDFASYSSIKIARIRNQDVALAWCRNWIIGFEPAKGKIQFRYPWRSRILESVNASSPVVSGDQVFLSECYGPGSILLKVTEEEVPDVVWKDGAKRDKSMLTHWNTCVLIDGYLYGSSGRQSSGAEIRCIKLQDGKVQWKHEGFKRASLTAVDGHLVIHGEYGELALIKANPEKFELVTEYKPVGDQPKLKYPCWAAPIVSHGLLIVRGKNQVVAFDLIPVKK